MALKKEVLSRIEQATVAQTKRRPMRDNEGKIDALPCHIHFLTPVSGL